MNGLSRRPFIRFACGGAASFLGLLTLLSLPGCQGDFSWQRTTRQTEQSHNHAKTQREFAELVRAGFAAIRSGDLERARTQLKRAIEMAPASGEAHHALGMVYYELDDLYNAAVHLNISAQQLRNRVEPCHNLGIVLENGGKYELAQEAYERGLTRQSDHLPTTENLARVRIKAGLKDRETLRLLSICIERENRPDWREWLDQQRTRLEHRLGQNDLAKLPSEDENVAEGNVSNKANIGG